MEAIIAAIILLVSVILLRVMVRQKKEAQKDESKFHDIRVYNLMITLLSVAATLTVFYLLFVLLFVNSIT